MGALLAPVFVRCSRTHCCLACAVGVNAGIGEFAAACMHWPVRGLALLLEGNR